MLQHSFRLGRVGGAEVRIDASWVVIALLVAYSLFLQFGATYPSLQDPGAIALAAVATLLFFGSVLAHELTHALVARRLGIPVQGITLFIFGGVTQADVDSRAARQEFVVSVVGPASSLVLGAVFWGLALLGDRILPAPVAGALGYLGWVNLILAGFNLLPGFPLDGGRIFRSAVWAATGDIRRATRAATVSGQLLGYVMIAGGFLLVFGGALMGGVWLAAIGWFLAQSARASYHQLELRRLLTGVEADRVMEGPLRSVPGELSLREAVDRYLLVSDQSVFPVEHGGATVGVLTAEAVREVPQGEWAAVHSDEAMRPIDRHNVVGPHASVEEIIERFRTGAPYLLVESERRLVGVLTPDDLSRWIRRQRFVVDEGNGGSG